MHNIDLDHLPVLDTGASKSTLQWIHLLYSLQFSNRERDIHSKFVGSKFPASEVAVSLKDLLNLIISQSAGVTPPPSPPCKPIQVFQLQAPEMGVFTILFVMNLRLDPASFTVVADVAALPLDIKIMEHIAPGITALLGGLDLTI
jgi:hypothetical protein